MRARANDVAALEVKPMSCVLPVTGISASMVAKNTDFSLIDLGSWNRPHE
jgi:hypothetical protein